MQNNTTETSYEKIHNFCITWTKNQFSKTFKIFEKSIINFQDFPKLVWTLSKKYSLDSLEMSLTPFTQYEVLIIVLLPLYLQHALLYQSL